MTEIIVGIDLGTTNSAIAYVKDGEPEIISIDAQPTMPSCVGIDPAGKLIVGQPAHNMLITAPESTVLSIKRHMGEDAPVTMGGKSFSPEEISSFILRRLKTEAEKFLGQPVTKAVITVPAFFNEAQRKATQNAGALAELEVVRIINEPTAAALAYEAGHASDQRILVYDLGGGTFDVSVVVVEAGVVEVKSSHGDTHLGGDDFDQLLVQHVVDKFHEKHGVFLNEDARTMRRLKVVLERAKCQLSDEPFVSIREEYIHGDLHLEIEISRDEYEEMIRPYLLKTIDCMHQSLQDARLLPRDLSKVMLVGGATRTPLVHRLIKEKFGIEPRWEINPDLIVALGASISGSGLAGAKSKSILVDITSHSFGTAVLAGQFFDEHLAYAPIIHRNTPLPASKTDCFFTLQDHQPVVDVQVYEGEDPIPENNTLIGRFFIEGLSKAPAGSPILVNFTLDLNGMLKVTAIEKDTGLKKSVTLDTRGARPSLDLEEARKNIESLVNPGVDLADDAFASDEASEKESDEAEEPDHDELLRSAKDLRKRGEHLLTQGISEDDAGEVRDLLKRSSETISARQWEELQSLNETLSDLVFYLED